MNQLKKRLDALESTRRDDDDELLELLALGVLSFDDLLALDAPDHVLEEALALAA